MMTLIDNGGKNNVGRTSPIWDNVASESSNMRTPLQYFEHYLLYYQNPVSNLLQLDLIFLSSLPGACLGNVRNTKEKFSS